MGDPIPKREETDTLVLYVDYNPSTEFMFCSGWQEQADSWFNDTDLPTGKAVISPPLCIHFFKAALDLKSLNCLFVKCEKYR